MMSDNAANSLVTDQQPPESPAHSQSATGFSGMALITLLAGATLIAFSPIFVRLADIDPTVSAFYRAFLALPFLWGFAKMENRVNAKRGNTDMSRLTPAMMRALVISGLCFAGDLITWHIAIDYTSVANATLLGNFAPLFVTFGAFFLFGEKIRPLFLVALVLSIGGAAAMIGASFSLGGDAVIGDGYALVTAMFYGAYLLAIKGLRDRLCAGTLMFWSSAITAIGILPFALLSGGDMIPRDAETWFWLFMLAWLSHGLGQTLIAMAFGHLPAGFSSLALLFQPCLAALFGWLILAEPLGLLQTSGGLLVLFGVWLAKKAST